MCGQEILKKDGSINKRASWHPACVVEYRLIHFPTDTRRAVWKRDRGVCYLCGENAGRHGWEVEHIKPLYESNGDITYWQLSNIAAVCVPCHQKKSAKEAGQRAQARRDAAPPMKKKVKKP